MNLALPNISIWQLLGWAALILGLVMIAIWLGEVL